MNRENYMVLGDGDRPYLERLGSGLAKFLPGYRIMSFSDREKLSAFLNGQRAEIVLVNEEWKLPETKGDTRIFRFTDKEAEKENEICRYSPVSEIAEVLKKDSNPVLPSAEEKGKYYGVYAPAGHPRREIFAEELAEKLGKKEQTLLADLNEFSAGHPEQEWTKKRDLTDLIYFYRIGRLDREKCERIVKKREGYDFLSSPMNPEELADMEDGELISFFQKLLEENTYRNLVVDFGASVGRRRDLFFNCEKIFLLLFDTERGKEQKQFMDLFFSMRKKAEWEKEHVIPVFLPAADESKGREKEKYHAFFDEAGL